MRAFNYLEESQELQAFRNNNSISFLQQFDRETCLDNLIQNLRKSKKE